MVSNENWFQGADYMRELGSLPDADKNQTIAFTCLAKMVNSSTIKLDESGLTQLVKIVHFARPHQFT